MVISNMLPLLKKYHIPFLFYSHELPPMYDSIKKQDLDWLVNNAKGAIGCSNQVCQNLKQLGFKNVELFYECVNISEVEIDEELYLQKKEELKNFRSVFLMSGQRGYYKGYQLLPQMLDFLKAQNSALIWLGKPSDYGLDYYVTKQLENSNIILPGQIQNRKEYYTWIKLADAFVLTSIIDPYPLVMLEAAYLQKPVLAFNSGGVSEFVKEGMGSVINNFNVSDLTNVMQKFMQNEIPIDVEKLKQEGIKHDIQNNIDKFEQIVTKYIE
jgi:glycosyltransferase involved in cell wall biosynthesis